MTEDVCIDARLRIARRRFMERCGSFALAAPPVVTLAAAPAGRRCDAAWHGARATAPSSPALPRP